MQAYLDRLKTLSLPQEQKDFVLKVCNQLEKILVFPSKAARDAVYDEHIHDITPDDLNGLDPETQADGAV